MSERAARAVLTSLCTLFAAPVGMLLGWTLLFFTPFVPRPLFEQVPQVGQRYCPSETRLVVEHYSRTTLVEAKNYARVVCVGATGKTAVEVTNRVMGEVALALSALSFLLLWPATYRWVGPIRMTAAPPGAEGRPPSRFMPLMLVALGLFLVWALPHLFQQKTPREQERAALVIFAAMGALIGVLMVAAYLERKRNTPQGKETRDEPRND